MRCCMNAWEVCILAVRLLARAAMHVARVSHHHFRDTTDDVMDGFPIDARTFHADDWTLLFGQPGGKSLQLWNGRSEFLSRLMHMLHRELFIGRPQPVSGERRCHNKLDPELPYFDPHTELVTKGRRTVGLPACKGRCSHARYTQLGGVPKTERTDSVTNYAFLS